MEDGTVVREGSPSQIANPTSQISAQILPADPAERLHLAARAIADRCLYGVDINPMAVEMAKLSLWLITVDRERPFTFLDHALKCGDSLLGLSDARQLERFSLRPADAAQPLFDTANLWRHVQQAATLRRQLEATPSHTASQLVEKARLHREAETALAKLRAAADFLIAAELDTPGDRGWDTRRAIAASHMQAGWKKDIAEFQRLARAELRGRRPFHWPLEFPEVFDAGENGERPAGFDAFVGNPPFMGGQKITGELGTDYRDYLVEKIAGGQRGSADFCAYFFLRVHSLLNPVHGIAGLVATNTIAQGDSREVGLEQIAAAGALIPRAVPSCPWPGVAALEVAHVWFRRGSWAGVWTLDDKTVNGITAFLTEPGRASGKPFRLAAAAEKSFQGSIVLGMGFVLAPEQAAALIASDDRNRAVLFPYLSGKDFTSRPDISPSRWVINFHDWPLERTGEGSWLQASDKQRETWLRSGRVPSDYAESVAADFPDCLGIVERLVKPERADNNREVYRRYWWQYAEKRPALAQALRTSGGACFCSRVSAHHYFAVAEGVQVFSERLVVVVLPTLADFAVLSATIHDLWAHRPGQTTHETRNTYFNESAFETFPFPTDLSGLETIGERYHEHRRQLMLARGEGLTKTYNRFHDRGPDGAGADIAELRALHRQLDTAVAAAYGWPDLAANDGAALGHDFHATKQGTRHTLAPTARREILDRLLALNHTRHAEELAAGLHDKKKPKTKRAPAKPARGAAPQGELFQPPQPELF